MLPQRERRFPASPVENSRVAGSASLARIGGRWFGFDSPFSSCPLLRSCCSVGVLRVDSRNPASPSGMALIVSLSLLDRSSITPSSRFAYIRAGQLNPQTKFDNGSFLAADPLCQRDLAPPSALFDARHDSSRRPPGDRRKCQQLVAQNQLPGSPQRTSHSQSAGQPQPSSRSDHLQTGLESHAKLPESGCVLQE